MTPDELIEAAHTLHNLAHRLFGDKPTPVPSEGWADVTEEVRSLRRDRVRLIEYMSGHPATRAWLKRNGFLTPFEDERIGITEQ